MNMPSARMAWTLGVAVLLTCSAGTAMAQAPAATLRASPVARLGAAWRLRLETGMPGVPYAMDLGFTGHAPGFVLPTSGRTIPLNAPWLLSSTPAFASSPIFSGFTGLTDAAGRATALIHVPADPAFIGLAFDVACITLDAQAPEGIGLISNPVHTQVIQAQDNSASPLGNNLPIPGYWTTDWPFVDVFKFNSGWLPQLVSGSTWNTGASLNLTPDGWVASLSAGQAAGVLLCRNGGHYPAGHYVCLYEGEGTFAFAMDAAILSAAAGRIVLNVQPTVAGIHLKLLSTNPANPARNIRIIMPGFEHTHRGQPFHPLFLQRLAHYKVLRFMHWQQTVATTNANWSERTTPGTMNQAIPNGVALETMLELCNTLDADGWFCMPHLCTDDYMTQFAAMVRDQLDPALKAYIEYSNEVWNSSFPAAAWCQAQGLTLGLSTNAYQAQLRFQSQRSVQMFQIWNTVFGGTSRLVRVMAAQAVNAWTSSTLLDWQNAAQTTDALAIAPYFGGQLGNGNQAPITQQMTVQQVLAAAAAASLANATPLAAQKAVAQSHNVELICYEAGQHMVGVGAYQNDPTLISLFTTANRDPAMHGIYLADLAQWRQIGGHLRVDFNTVGPYNNWGSFGSLEYLDQPLSTAPKYQALLDFVITNPRWW